MAKDRSSGADAFSLGLPVRISAVEEARLAVLAFLAPFALDDRVINRIEVILEELLTNIVRHAHGASRISLRAQVCDRAVQLEIGDDGNAFNPLAMAEPEPYTTLEAAPLGKQGIPLVKRLSRSVRYARVGPMNVLSAAIAA